jgi:hypothetical protein
VCGRYNHRYFASASFGDEVSLNELAEAEREGRSAQPARRLPLDVHSRSLPPLPAAPKQSHTLLQQRAH